MITRLIKLANMLDQKGFYDEASQLDEIIKQAIAESMEWPQPGEQDFLDPDTRTHPYSEKYMGEGEEPVPHDPSGPSEEARIMALKYKLLKAYGKEYEPLLTEDVLKRFLNMLGMPDIGGPGPGSDLWDRHMKFLLFDDRMRRDECISCGAETPEAYLEKGEDVVSSPICNNCFRVGIGDVEEDFLERKDPELLENLHRFFVDIKDPSEMEELYSGFEEEDDDDYPSPEDDDYDPEKIKAKEKIPSMKEMADLWR